jgi:hypothetical protein
MNTKSPAFPAILALFLALGLLWALIIAVVILWRSIILTANALSPKPHVVSAAELAVAFEPIEDVAQMEPLLTARSPWDELAWH